MGLYHFQEFTVTLKYELETSHLAQVLLFVNAFYLLGRHTHTKSHSDAALNASGMTIHAHCKSV